jgi:dTDP-4-dehydrorhamnose 3,5-epimerase
MIFKETPLNNAFVLNLEKIEDDRGFFARYFCQEEFKEYGLLTDWVQMNISMNKNKGTIRGMHFQNQPKADAKIVRCLHGAIWDVVVDLRYKSTTYGEWFGIELNDENRSMMYVPQGFAHGFQTISDNAELLYIHSDSYSPKLEGGINVDSPEVCIKWPLPVTEISERDAMLPSLNEIEPLKI